MMWGVKRIALTLLIGIFLAGCGPDLAGIRPDNPLKEDGTLQLAQPEIQQQQNQGGVLGQSQQQVEQRQLQQEIKQQQLPQQQALPTPKPTELPADFPQKPEIPDETKATISTSKGEIVIKLYSEKSPKTVKNFTDKAGSNFYEGLTFHRVEDWVIQGGDPKGDGTGGGDQPTELNNEPFKLGSVGVARAGDIKVSNDSQFFICTADCSWLTNQYTNFGEVVEGLEVAQSIVKGDTITGIKVE